MIQSNLKQRLDVLRGTLKRAITLNGVGRLAIALVGCFFLALFLDYFIFRWDRPVNTAFRVVMLLGVVGTAGWILYYKLIAPLSVPLNTDDMALAVEKEFPNLNDSLISTMQLTRMMSVDGSVSSPMVEEVARQAHEATAALNFDNVVKFDRIKSILIGGGVAVAVFLIALAVPASRTYVQIGLLRLANPFSKVHYPVETEIAIKGGGHEIAWPRGESLKIVAEVSGSLPDTAYIRFDHGSGLGAKEPITTARIVPSDDLKTRKKEFEFEYNPVNSNFSYVVLAGDNQSVTQSVRAVDRPRVDNMDIEYEYPAYISDTKSERKRDTQISGVVGTKATITVIANKPLDEAQVKFGNDQPVVIRDFSADKKTFIANVTLDASKDYDITLLDTDRLDNSKNKTRYKITVKNDTVPRITWKRPATDLEVTPQAIVSLGLTAEDDFGLQKSVIKYKRFHMITPPAPAGGQNVPAPVVDASQPALEGQFDLAGEYGKTVPKLNLSHEWALTDLTLQPGDMVEYWAEAYDWCPTKRKPAEPTIYRLKVLSINQLHTLLDVQRMRLVEDLIAIIHIEEADKKQVGAIAEHLKFGNPFDTTQRGRVSEAGSMQEDARRKTQALQKGFENLIGRYKSNGIDTPDETDRLREVAEQLAKEHLEKMPEASKMIVASAMLKEDPPRVDQLKKAEAKQVEILDDLNALLAKMQKWAETEELLRMTRELLAKQKMVTAETIPFKDRLGAKQPTDATKDELNEVKGLEHKERDCASDMKLLFLRMTQALAKMQSLDKAVAKNIEDAIKIAQNTDAAENKDISTAGDPTPGIEDKMTAAQADIAKFNFGTANGKQRASENALQAIITALSRRREIDSKLLKQLSEAVKQAEKNLEEQKRLTKLAKAIKDKDELVKSIAQAKQQISNLKQREEQLRDQTSQMNNQANAEAAGLDADLAGAKKDLQNLINEETALKNETEAAMSQPESDLARALSDLEEIEKIERALAKDSDGVAKSVTEKPTAIEIKKAEKSMIDNADTQANTKNSLDDISSRLAAMVRGGAIEKPEPQVAIAGKAAARALPDVEGASHDMAEAADVLRRGSPKGDKASAVKGSEFQLAAADKIAKARGALKEASMDLGKEKKSDFDKTGDKQDGTQKKAAALKEKLVKLGSDIDKAHAAASGALEKPTADPAGAAAKMGEASEQMGKAKDELKKPDPASATKEESKAIEAMKAGLEKMKEMERKLAELKDPARRLERVQTQIKDETRKVADEIKNIEDQLPKGPTDPKTEDSLKKAANSMQNAQSSLGSAKKSDSKAGESGKSGEGEKGGDGEKPGEKKKDDPSNPDAGGKKDDSNKGGDPSGSKQKDAEKEQEKAISELDKALKNIDELSKKAEAEGDNHTHKALDQLKKDQLAEREAVLQLQPKIAEMKDKTGSEKAGKAEKANENAAKNQSASSGQMGKGQQSDAQKSQEDAEQDLEEVLDNLKKLEQETREQQQKEKLFQIEQELKKMLTAQNEITKRTADTDKLPSGRPKKLTLIQVFKDQMKLAESTKVVTKLLEEAPVFQFVLQTATEDMNEAAARLDKDNSGTGTQEIQDDAAKKIADLIEALRKERQKPQPPKPGGSGSGSGSGKQPLVPSLAQMKMLLIMQKDVDKRFKAVDKEVTEGKTPDLNKDQKERIRRAADLEGKIARITDKTAKEIEGKDEPKDNMGSEEKGDEKDNGK